MSKNLINKLNEGIDSGSLFQYVDDSLAVSQVLNKLGFSNKGQYVKIVREFLLENDIDISHFTPNGTPKARKITKTCPCCFNEFTTEPRAVKEKIVCSLACSNTYFRSGKDHGNWLGGTSSYRKKALYFYGSTCCKCGYSNEGALEVHHKDKNRENNDISNLEVLCANCHRLLHKENQV